MYFYDSYAIVEMSRGNPRYLLYRGAEGVTSKLNLLESYYIFLRDWNERLAKACYEGHVEGAIDFPGELIPIAARFRFAQVGATGKRFSYADALGYTYSRSAGFEFLTGAHEFEGMPGVEFVR